MNTCKEAAAVSASGFLFPKRSDPGALGVIPLKPIFGLARPAGHLLLDGRMSDLYDFERYERAYQELTGQNLSFSTFPYPPHGLWLVLPLGWLSYFPGLIAWTLVTFAICAYVLVRFSGLGWKAICFLAFAPAAAINISSGQNGFVSAALLCAGLLLVERRPVLAGVLLGLLTYKPQLGLLVPFALLMGRHWTVIASAAATVAISCFR